MHGTCSECGLELEWGDVVRPQRWQVPGFVEHATGLWGTFAAAWRTWWWTFSPRSFWRRVNITAQVRPRRWLVWLAIVMLGTRLFAAAVYCAAATIDYRGNGGFGKVRDVWGAVAETTARALLRGVARADVYYSTRKPGVFRLPWHVDLSAYPVPVVLRWTPLLFVLPPVVLLLLPVTRRMAKIRAAHVGRTFVYSLAPLGVILVLDVLNAVRVFTRVKIGVDPFEKWLLTPRCDPSWPSVITEHAGAVVTTALPLLTAWLTVWWWQALHSWGLTKRKDLIATLVVIWCLGIAIAVGTGALFLIVTRSVWR
ncbi:MAG: hypothetical protein JSR77_13000 [Planctomycetes bacterium]|nr:hypothetical protein [Planctomycetota bacterium]